MQEMLAPTSALIGQGLVNRRARHGRRFSGGTWGMVVGHVAGGLRRRHDRAGEGALDHDRCEEAAHPGERLRKELAARRKNGNKPKPRYHPRPPPKYMKLVSTREQGRHHRRLRKPGTDQRFPDGQLEFFLG